MSMAGHGDSAIGNVHKISSPRFKLFFTKGSDINNMWGSRAVLGMRPTVIVQGGMEGYIGRMPDWAANGFLDCLSIW